MIIRYHLLMISIILLIIFAATTNWFLKAYNRYALQQAKISALQGRLGFMKQQQMEMKRKISLIADVNRFVNRARSLGLEKNRWSAYVVNLQEMVSFKELEQVVNQCVNSSTAYFEPELLHINWLNADSREGSGDTRPATVPTAGQPTGDLMVTLKGKFVVRQE